jgi:hypothetical protein
MFPHFTGFGFFTREPVGDLSLYFFSCITLIYFYFELNIYGRHPTIPTKIVPEKKVKGTPLERRNICVNFGFARLIWRPFIRSTEKRGRNHFFEECSLHIPLRYGQSSAKIETFELSKETREIEQIGHGVIEAVKPLRCVFRTKCIYFMHT